MKDLFIYCLGFVFSKDLRSVVLLKKKRMHRGTLNGLGGLVKMRPMAVELPIQAMSRECNEESGLIFSEEAWVDCAQLTGLDSWGNTWVVEVYATLDPEDCKHAKTMTDEIVEIHDTSKLSELELAPYTGMLISHCMEVLKGKSGRIEIKETP